MGLYDSVLARCPKCGKDVEFQSKAGARQLNNYSANDVPPQIAEDIEGKASACHFCGEVIKLRMAKPIARVRMVVDDGRNWD